MATAKFRAVGLYFGSKAATTGEVSVDFDGSDASVQTIMNAIQENASNGKYDGVSGFTFGSTTGDASELDFISVLYSESPNGSLPAGTYNLTESYDPSGNSSSYTVWQYYIYDENLVQVNFQSSFDAYTTPNPFGVDWDSQEYTVVWRLVTIVNDSVTYASTSKAGRRIAKKLKK